MSKQKLIINSTTDSELRPSSLSGVTINTSVEGGEMEVLESFDMPAPESAPEGEVTNINGGKIRLLCIPTDTPGPFYGGSLIYKSGCFDEWIASDGNASIRGDAHGRNPHYQLASRNAGSNPGGAVFSVDNVGLWAECTLLPDDEVSKNALSRIKAKMIEKCSVGTISNKVEEDYENDVTTVIKCDVRETSLVYTDEERFSGTDVTEASTTEAEAEPIEKMISSDEQDMIEMKAKLDNLSDKIDDIATSLQPVVRKSALELMLVAKDNTTTT